MISSIQLSIQCVAWLLSALWNSKCLFPIGCWYRFDMNFHIVTCFLVIARLMEGRFSICWHLNWPKDLPLNINCSSLRIFWSYHLKFPGFNQIHWGDRMHGSVGGFSFISWVWSRKSTWYKLQIQFHILFSYRKIWKINFFDCNWVNRCFCASSCPIIFWFENIQNQVHDSVERLE